MKELIAYTICFCWVVCLCKLARVDQSQGGRIVNDEPEIVAEQITYLYLERVAALEVRDRSSGERKRIFMPCDSNNLDREFKAYRAFCLGEKVDLSCNVNQ